MNQPQFVLLKAEARQAGCLWLNFADGYSGDADLTDIIAKHPSIAPLKDLAVFQAVAIDEWQRGVIFAGNDDLTLASDNLRDLCIEQASW